MRAMFTVSLGATCRGPPRTRGGTIVNAAAAAAEAFRNVRRLVIVGTLGAVSGTTRPGTYPGTAHIMAARPPVRETVGGRAWSGGRTRVRTPVRTSLALG